MDILPNSDVDNIDLVINDDKNQQTSNLVEEEYTNHSEALLKHWLEEARKNKTAHNLKGRKFKRKHELFGLPSVLLPIVYSPIAGLLADEPGVNIASVCVLIVTGILSGVYTFFDFGRKAERHFRYEALYSDLATTILVELSKSRPIRIRADRFIEMMQSKVDNLGANAPLL